MSNSNVIKFPVVKSVDMNQEEFIDNCKNVLSTEDYEDFLLGVMDYYYYNLLDDDLKDLVNSYFRIGK